MFTCLDFIPTNELVKMNNQKIGICVYTCTVKKCNVSTDILFLQRNRLKH